MYSNLSHESSIGPVSKRHQKVSLIKRQIGIKPNQVMHLRQQLQQFLMFFYAYHQCRRESPQHHHHHQSPKAKVKEKAAVQKKGRQQKKSHQVRTDNRFADDLIFAHRETLCNQVVMLPCFDFHAFFIAFYGILGAFTLAIGGWAFPLSFSKVFFGERAIYVIASILKCRFCGIESCRDRERS